MCGGGADYTKQASRMRALSCSACGLACDAGGVSSFTLPHNLAATLGEIPPPCPLPTKNVGIGKAPTPCLGEGEALHLHRAAWDRPTIKYWRARRAHTIEWKDYGVNVLLAEPTTWVTYIVDAGASLSRAPTVDRLCEYCLWGGTYHSVPLENGFFIFAV